MDTADRHPAQWLALGVGITYTLVGLGLVIAKWPATEGRRTARSTR